jgi:hypothetical protein
MENLNPQNNQKQNQKSQILPSSPLETILNQTTQEYQTSKEDPQPKKRGRPRVNKEAQAEKISQDNHEQILQYERMMGAILEFSGSYLSTATGFEGFKLKPDEKKLLSAQGAEVMQEFAPMIQGKYVKLGIFATSMVSVYGMKFYAFQTELAKTMIEVETNDQKQ